MKKNKGFTLIELLAVIVVLAIIALIATPIVMNTIKNTKKGAAERSGESYTKQVETAIMEYRMESGNTLPDGTYDINEDGNLTGNGLTTPLTIEMSGTKPSGGKITISNSQIKTENTFMTTKEYTVSYDTEKNIYVAKPLEVLCTKEDGVDLSNLTYGNKFTCELGDNDTKTFYVLETSGDNVSLIMNMDIDDKGKGTTNGNPVEWVSKEDYIAAGWSEEDWSYVGNNNKGPITANNYLISATANWSKLNPSQISLPSVYQIAAAGEITFDSNNSNPSYYPSGLPTWLYENINSCYWTSTPYAFNSTYAWFVGTSGYLVPSYITVSRNVRPVITISKTQLG